MGITDTAMLRPQVFALQEGEVSDRPDLLGEAGHRRHAASLAKEDQRFWPVADRYWNARGGSHTDGGAFIFTLEPAPERPHDADLRR